MSLLSEFLEITQDWRDVFPQQAAMITVVDTIVIPLIISIALVVGLGAMKKRFESFEIVEKQTAQKARAFSESKSKRKGRSR